MRKSLAAFGAALVAIISSGAAFAQDYPSRPITFRIGSAPGGLADLGARLFADVVSRSMGQRVVVENRVGASGIIATESVANAAPDGYTIVQLQSGTHEILPAAQTLPFDPIKDFQFITTLFNSTTFVVAPASTQVSSMKDVEALARRQQGGITMGSVGIGSPTGLSIAMFKAETKAPIEAVQYRGAVDLLNDILGKRVDFGVGAYNVFKPGIDDKQLKFIAINSTARSTRFPDIPTFAEQGFPNIVVAVWWGLGAPAKTPKPIVDRLYAEFTKAARDPDLIKKLEEQDIQVRTSTPDEFTAMVSANNQRLGKAIKELGIKLE